MSNSSSISSITLAPKSKVFGTIQAPGSKSICNRVLPMAAFANGSCLIRNLSKGDDVVYMKSALEKLGIPMYQEDGNLRITGLGRPHQHASASPLKLFLGNSGTCMRFLASMLSAGKGYYRLQGEARMYERPIQDLVQALEGLGAQGISYTQKEGCPPLEIQANGLQGASTCIKGEWSSQFVTGLLLALPLCRESARAEVVGHLVSKPYIEMTLKLMEIFGVEIKNQDWKQFSIDNPHGYSSPESISIEPDASSSSYFLAAAAIAGGTITVPGLSEHSLQGEAKFAYVLEKMGAKVSYGNDSITVSRNELRGIDVDMDALTDTGMTLAVTALFADGQTRIRNIGNWRVKETDRIKAMATELRKLGAEVEEGIDNLIINPPKRIQAAEIETYNDHRMAMSFSLACFGSETITILNPSCTNKTYPDYFGDFQRLLA